MAAMTLSSFARDVECQRLGIAEIEAELLMDQLDGGQRTPAHLGGDSGFLLRREAARPEDVGLAPRARQVRKPIVVDEAHGNLVWRRTGSQLCREPMLPPGNAGAGGQEAAALIILSSGRRQDFGTVVAAIVAHARR